MKIKSKWVAGSLLGLALVLGLMPGSGLTANAATSMPAAVDGVVKLTDNVELSSTWEPSGTVTLDLNGFGIKKTGAGSVIKLNGGANLTIIDSNPTSTHKFSLDSSGMAVLDEAGGDIAISGGYITGGSGVGENNGYFWSSGGGVWVKNGTLTMNAGTIIGNNAGQGGGVAVYSGTFNFNGGAISYNGGDAGIQLRCGSDQYNTGGGGTTATLNMTGGEVKHNVNHGICGTNYCYGVSTANISGGVISDNGGHGVTSKNVTITNDVVISNNGGIGANGTNVTISGQTSVTNNRNRGVWAASLTLSGSPTISGNTMDVSGTATPTNIYIGNDRTITIVGTLANTTPFGVTMQTPGVFTKSTEAGAAKAKDYAENFTSDVAGYSVIVEGDELKLSDKLAQTITAEDINVTYGASGISVSAETDGDGTISYAVKAGYEDYAEIDAVTGALTVKKAGTVKIVISVTGTDTYSQATKEITLTINKADSVPATVTANNRTYNGKEKALVKVNESTLVGGTMMYALGTDDITAPALDSGSAAGTESLWTDTIPTGKKSGKYYVWYKVVGDENHTDTAPVCVKVTIKKESSSDSGNETPGGGTTDSGSSDNGASSGNSSNSGAAGSGNSTAVTAPKTGDASGTGSIGTVLALSLAGFVLFAYCGVRVLKNKED